jgi:hypothetical protein
MGTCVIVTVTGSTSVVPPLPVKVMLQVPAFMGVTTYVPGALPFAIVATCEETLEHVSFSWSEPPLACEIAIVDAADEPAAANDSAEIGAPA